MNNRIHKTVIFPVVEAVSGTNIAGTVAQLEKSQWWTKAHLLELQNKKLRAIVQHAYHNVPFYRRLFKQHNILPEDIQEKKDLLQLPVLTKEDIKKNISDMVAKNIPISRIMSTYSSGSTGEPLKYYLDKASYSAGWAQTFRCWSWAADFRIGDPYVKIGLEERSSIRKNLQDRVMNTQYIGFSGIHRTNIRDVLKKIGSFNPKIIRSNTDFIYPIAKMMEQEDFQYSGATVTTTASILFPHYRNLVEKQFNCRILDAYGGEGTPVSFQCEKCEHYHIAEEDVIVEFMKENEYVSEEEPGKIIITNLNNYAMPLIHYDLNDLGQFLEDTCSCGRNLSLMKSIEGRDNDIVKTASGDLIPVHFFSYLFRDMPGVDQFQVIQERIDRITFKIVINKQYSESDTEYITNKVRNKTGGQIVVDFQFVGDIPTSGRSGKRRYVISHVPFPIKPDNGFS
jgi:phenylacetate-CoA ligase